MTASEEIPPPVREALRWLVIAIVALYLIVAGVAAFTYVQTAETQDALCALDERQNVRAISC